MADTASTFRQLEPITGVWNPEDLIALEGTPWVLVTGMKSPGRSGAFFFVDRRDPRAAEPVSWQGAPRLGSHGLTARRRDDGRFDVLLVDHEAGEAVLLLDLAIGDSGPTVVSSRRIEMPAGTSGNAAAFFGTDAFLATSMFDPTASDTLALFERALPTGHVWRHDAQGGWCKFGEAGYSGGNGMVVDDKTREVFLSEWAASKIWRLDSAGRQLQSVQLDFLPDNLRWDNGTILIAGQRATPDQVHDCQNRGTPCPRRYSVARLDPATLAAQVIFTGGDRPEEQFAGATGAAAVGHEIWLGSFMGTTVSRIAIS